MAGGLGICSLQMLAIAWFLSGILGLGLGIVSGALAGSWIDRVIRLYAYTLASSPAFWVALLLIGLRPFAAPRCAGVLAQDVTFWQHLQHLLLPPYRPQHDRHRQHCPTHCAGGLGVARQYHIGMIAISYDQPLP